MGLGPVCFDGETGAPGGQGDTAPTTPPATPPTPPSNDGNMIPKARFDEVNREYQRILKAQEEKDRKDAEAKGEFEKLAASERERAEKEAKRASETEAKALAFARRAGFVSAASGKVADPQAAYKLAVADGLLEGLEVTDDGDVDADKVTKIVEKLVEAYPFLAGQTRNPFGGPSGGNQPSPPIDPSKLSPRQKIGMGLRPIER
jgi:hypothetical protein